MGVSTRASLVSASFVRLANSLVGEFDVVDLLHVLATESVLLLDASAAGLLLADSDGILQVLASTSEESQLVESLQSAAGAGPCVDCYNSGATVSIADIATTVERWPVFAPAALSQGFRSVHAIPMRVRGQTIGALNMFRSDTGELSSEDSAIGQALADVATISILQERAVRESTILNEQLQHALNSRILIEQAKGVIAFTSNVDMDEAFRRLRNHARAHRTPLSKVAENVINRAISL
jgi:GAF domain-containing protein